MAKTISIGAQDFEYLRKNQFFYLDKTSFIKEWWEGGDVVTLITRPRRFGKTLTMSMVSKFFSVEQRENGKLFEGLSIWEEKPYRELQGTYPVIFLSFAGIKCSDFPTAREKICQILMRQYSNRRFLLEGDLLDEKEKAYYLRVSEKMNDADASAALNFLAEFLFRYYGKKAIILLDEYDTPLQEAYVNGYWDELVIFIRGLFNETFKTNDYFERALLTGITRVSKESVFSDLNNLAVITTTSERYAACFGFTEKEVFHVLDEYGMSDCKSDVKEWYDGFTFGHISDIYNPWSITSFLKEKKLKTYWANTSENSLVNQLIQEGTPQTKMVMEDLLVGESLVTEIDEEIIFNQLNQKKGALWSLLLASGYLKVISTDFDGENFIYRLELTNKEVRLMFRKMIQGWFEADNTPYNEFIQALLKNDVKAMNAYMNRVALATFSFFDSGKHPSDVTEPERFYHGFVLGLMVELSDRYVLTSNRESGFGRYDVMLEPRKPKQDDGIIMEFKVFDPEEEKSLKDTAQRALRQIDEMSYAVTLEEKGIPRDRIHEYGFAFCGKTVLIQSGD